MAAALSPDLLNSVRLLPIEKQYQWLLENHTQWRESCPDSEGAMIMFFPSQGSVQFSFRQRGEIYGDFLRGKAIAFNQALLTHINKYDRSISTVVGYIAPSGAGYSAIVMH